jgi:hypothetical protein
MGTLAELNSYSSTDVVTTVQTQNLIYGEGAQVEMPLMAWTPIHDIGPLTGNGVQITHTFAPGNIIMSNGTILTPAQYANVVVDQPTTSTTGNVTAGLSPLKFINQNVFIASYSGVQSAVLVNMTESDYDISTDFCAEFWHYPTAVSGNTNHLIVYANDFTAFPELAMGFSLGRSTTNFMTLLVNGTRYVKEFPKAGFLNNWQHVAVVRHNGAIRLYYNGVLQTLGIGGYNGTQVTSVPSTADFSHIAEYFRIGNKKRDITWGGFDPGPYGYLDQVRFSNVARYTSNFAVPTAAWTDDVNTVFLIQAVNGVIEDIANTYALNRVLQVPTLNLRGGRPNVALYKPSTNVYQIRQIHDPLDYLAGGVRLLFARDYYGVGNPDEPGTLSWTTNIKNLDVATYDYTYTVNLSLENTREVTNTELADLVYNFYGNSVAVVNNVLTLFNNTTQTTQIADSENPDSDAYTVTINTQHHPSLIVLDTTTVANIAKNFYYANGVPGANGQFIMSGTKSNVNDALLNLTMVKNSNPGPTDNRDRPNARNMVARTVTTSPVTNYSFSASSIQTNLIAEPPAPGIFYCNVPNPTSISGQSALNMLLPNANPTTIANDKDNSWNLCTWISNNQFTHEFWVYINDVSQNCTIHTSEWSLALFNQKFWMCNDPYLPGEFSKPNTIGNRPRRLEHNTTIANGTWYHIAMTYDVNANGLFKFYVNGIDNSTVYRSANNVVSVADASTGFSTNTGYSGTFKYGGWEINAPGLSGRLAQLRLSKTVRYNSNFVPPNRLYINDSNTIYLHQFNTTLAADDNALPVMTTAAKTMTWTITNPVNTTIASLQQNYYPDIL